MKVNRRTVIKNIGAGMATYGLLGSVPFINGCNDSRASEQTLESTAAAVTNEEAKLFFNISLAQWSLHKGFFGPNVFEKGYGKFMAAMQSDPDSALQGELDPLNFPIIAKQEFGIDTIELVNTFYYTKAANKDYLSELKNRAEGEGVKISLLMCDMEGDLGDTDDKKRMQAVENHYKWIEAIQFLGGQTIRVNAAGEGTAEEVKASAAESLTALATYAQQEGINVVVENHGGYSSDGKWLVDLMKIVNLPNCGTLPDFGNFCIDGFPWDCKKQYDPYQGVKELMPFAKGVSAKTHDFDEDGSETQKDFKRLLQIVKDAGFSGNIGVEYEGRQLSEKEGILATKALLERFGKSL